jgi:hypothetical protein
MVFIELEKAYDKIQRAYIWCALEKHIFPTKYITLIRDMYDNVVTSVRTRDSEIETFPILIGLQQGLALSPFMFCFSDEWGDKVYTRRYSLVYPLC